MARDQAFDECVFENLCLEYSNIFEKKIRYSFFAQLEYLEIFNSN